MDIIKIIFYLWNTNNLISVPLIEYFYEFGLVSSDCLGPVGKQSFLFVKLWRPLLYNSFPTIQFLLSIANHKPWAEGTKDKNELIINMMIKSIQNIKGKWHTNDWSCHKWSSYSNGQSQNVDDCHLHICFADALHTLAEMQCNYNALWQ